MPVQVAVNETWPVGKLRPYENNARTHDDDQIAKICNSITKFGFTNPILVWNDTIVAGHGRLSAAVNLGMPEVPVRSLDYLDETEMKAYVLADNRLAMDAGWNDDILASELAWLDDQDFDISLTGFTDEEIQDLMPDEEAHTDEDEVPDLPETPVTIEGDVWILGNHRLMCGDSTDAGTVALLMNGHKADMVFTDPPYGVDYDGINNDDRGGLEDLLDKSFANYIEFAKSGSSIYVFHSDKCADIFHDVFRRYFHFSSMIIWVKNSLTLSRTDYQSKHEPCMYGWGKDGTHKFFGDRKQTSTWLCDKETVSGHTTPKPITVVEQGVLNSSKSGDLVLDLFGGSGSTLIACEKNKRHSNMMELDPKYCDVIVKRWEEYTKKTATLDGDTRTFKEIGDERL